MMAPLRAMGGAHAMSAVDLDDAGYGIYSGVVDDWGGELEFEKADAVKWLRGQRRKFDAIVEDLLTLSRLESQPASELLNLHRERVLSLLETVRDLSQTPDYPVF